MKLKLSLALPIVYLALSSNILFLKGNASITNADANLSYTIPVTQFFQKIQVNLYLFHSFTNSINKQFISNYIPKITPKPSSVKKIIDSFNNHKLILTFSNIQSNIYIKSKFIFNCQLDIFSLDNYYEYPLPSSSIKHVLAFLKTSHLTSSSHKMFQLTSQLTKNTPNQFQTVISILVWIKKNITLKHLSPHSESRSTFFFSQGNRYGILNLTLALLRLAKIPARFVHGISLNESFLFQQKIANFEIQYPKSFYSWIEIYFPNQDWVAFDPLISFFFVPHKFLRRNVGIDSSENNSISSSNQSNLNIHSQFFVNVSKSIKNISVHQSYLTKNPSQLLTSSFSTKYQNWLKLQTNTPYNSIPHPNDPLSLKPSTLSFNHNKPYIDLKVSPNFNYYQKIYLHKIHSILSIQIPLFLFRNSRSGSLWIELYQNSQNPQNPVGHLIQVSKSIPVKHLLHLSGYSWVSFSFPHKLTKKGSFWFSLKHQTQEIILWRAIFANPFQSNNDTFYISSKSSKNTFIYLDLCFHISLHNPNTQQ